MEIWKYAVRPSVDPYTIDMPIGAKPLHVHDGYLWCLVDPKQATTPRIVLVVGTGWDFDPSGLAYVDTCHQNGFVWHVWM